MADRKKDGVVNANCEVFDYPGLFVTDGATIPIILGGKYKSDHSC
ncbi:MAG: GMC oxidoreductase [Bacteroidetes bacterium]|nr:GMC oxidoreductase [Bacteroidota bacterium]